MAVEWIYRPCSGDKVFAERPHPDIGVVSYPNGCRHVAGAVRLVFGASLPGDEYWRDECRTAAELAIERQGGLAADEQGTIVLFVAPTEAPIVLRWMELIRGILGKGLLHRRIPLNKWDHFGNWWRVDPKIAADDHFGDRRWDGPDRWAPVCAKRTPDNKWIYAGAGEEWVAPWLGVDVEPQVGYTSDDSASAAAESEGVCWDADRIRRVLIETGMLRRPAKDCGAQPPEDETKEEVLTGDLDLIVTPEYLSKITCPDWREGMIRYACFQVGARLVTRHVVDEACRRKLVTDKDACFVKQLLAGEPAYSPAYEAGEYASQIAWTRGVDDADILTGDLDLVVTPEELAEGVCWDVERIRRVLIEAGMGGDEVSLAVVDEVERLDLAHPDDIEFVRNMLTGTMVGSDMVDRQIKWTRKMLLRPPAKVVGEEVPRNPAYLKVAPHHLQSAIDWPRPVDCSKPLSWVDLEEVDQWAEDGWIDGQQADELRAILRGEGVPESWLEEAEYQTRAVELWLRESIEEELAIPAELLAEVTCDRWPLERIAQYGEWVDGFMLEAPELRISDRQYVQSILSGNMWVVTHEKRRHECVEWFARVIRAMDHRESDILTREES